MSAFLVTLRSVFRDAGYASDAVKINIEQIFKALKPAPRTQDAVKAALRHVPKTKKLRHVFPIGHSV